MERTRLAVVGVGHLGKEHARILSEHPKVELVGVVDARREQAEAVAQRCRTQPHTDHRALLDRVDAAVIAVPHLLQKRASAVFGLWHLRQFICDLPSKGSSA